jgi:hypothetical protein
MERTFYTCRMFLSGQVAQISLGPLEPSYVPRLMKYDGFVTLTRVNHPISMIMHDMERFTFVFASQRAKWGFGIIATLHGRGENRKKFSSL